MSPFPPFVYAFKFLWYYDDIGLPIVHWNVLRFIHRLILSTLSGYVRTSAVPITHLCESLLTSSSTSPCSQTVGYHIKLAFNAWHDIVCCQYENIDQFPLNNYFPAQSLHFHYDSVAPCPTLRAYVTSSLPRTWYGRGATPYPTGLPCCDIISLQRLLAQSVENNSSLTVNLLLFGLCFYSFTSSFFFWQQTERIL